MHTMPHATLSSCGTESYLSVTFEYNESKLSLFNRQEENYQTDTEPKGSRERDNNFFNDHAQSAKGLRGLLSSDSEGLCSPLLSRICIPISQREGERERGGCMPTFGAWN